MKGLALDSGEFIPADELNAKWLPRKATEEEMSNVQMNTPKLPPLPKPDTHCFDEDTGNDVWSHSPEQMQAYATAATEPLLQRIAELERQLEEARNQALEAFDSAVESARLLGGTQYKKGFGSYTEDDARFELAMNQAIAKHRAAMQKGQS